MASEPRTVAPKFRTGDVVLHGPTGETWVIAYDDGRYVVPYGWPLCFATAEDCTLKKAATDAAHAKLVQELADMSEDDPRRRWARRTLGLT